jgi:hypothetical protein
MDASVTWFLDLLSSLLNRNGYAGFSAYVGQPGAADHGVEVAARKQALLRITQAHELQDLAEIDSILAEHNEVRTRGILEARQSQAAIEAATQMLTEKSPAMHAKLLGAMREMVVDEASKNVKRPLSYSTTEGKTAFHAIVDEANRELVCVNAVLAYYEYHTRAPHE